MTQAEKPHRGVGSPAERLRDLADEVTEKLEAVARELGDAPTRSSKADQLRGVAGFVSAAGSRGEPAHFEMLRELLRSIFDHPSHPERLRNTARSNPTLIQWATALYGEAARLDGWEIDHNGTARRPEPEAAEEPPTGDDPLPMRRLVNVLEAMVSTPDYYDWRAKLKDLVRRQRKDCPYHDGCIHADDLFKVKELLEGRTVTPAPLTLATTGPGAKALAAVEAYRQKYLATVDVAKQVEQELRAIAATVLPLDSARIHAVADKLAEVNGRREEKPSVPLTNIPTYLRATLEESEQTDLRKKLEDLRSDCVQIGNAALAVQQPDARQTITTLADRAADSAKEIAEEIAEELGAGRPPPCAVFRPSQRAEVLKLLEDADNFSNHYAFKALVAAIRKIVTA